MAHASFSKPLVCAPASPGGTVADARPPPRNRAHSSSSASVGRTCRVCTACDPKHRTSLENRDTHTHTHIFLLLGHKYPGSLSRAAHGMALGDKRTPGARLLVPILPSASQQGCASSNGGSGSWWCSELSNHIPGSQQTLGPRPQPPGPGLAAVGFPGAGGPQPRDRPASVHRV